MKRHADGSKTHQNQRPMFSHQPARIVLFDIPSFVEHKALEIWCEALENVMSLACSLSGPNRIPFLGIVLIRNYPEVLLPLQPLRGNFVRLLSAVNEIRSSSLDCYKVTPSAIGQALRECLTMFRRQAQGFLQTAGYWSQLELSIVTRQDAGKLFRILKSLVVQLNLEGLKRIQLVSISTDGNDPSDTIPIITNADESDHDDDIATSQDDNVDILEHITIDSNILCIENYLMGWLHDSGTDQEHIQIILPVVDPGAEFILKCDIQERIINTNVLPFANCFQQAFGLESLCNKPVPQSSSRTVLNALPTSKLIAVYKLPADAVCESVLYGMPFVARATSCWKMDWDDLETNQQRFQAVCHLLAEKNEVLLARLEPGECQQTRGFRYNTEAVKPNGMFLLLPSDKGSMLIKPIATRELVLPLNSFNCDQPSEGFLEEVRKALDMVDQLDYYNPLLTSSNLFRCLIANLTKNVPASLARPVPHRQKQASASRLALSKTPSLSFTTAKRVIQKKEATVTREGCEYCSTSAKYDEQFPCGL